MNDLLDFSVAGTKVLGAAADDYLATMEKNIKEKYNPNMQLPYVDEGIEPEDVPETQESKKIDAAMNFPRGNYMNYQTQHNPKVRQSSVFRWQI